MEHTQQESRTEKAAIALTPREKQAIRFIAIRRKTTESEMLRDRARVDELVAEYERLMDALDQMEPPVEEVA